MYTYGADPEIFISNNGEFISAHTFSSGTKQHPEKVNHGAIQVDGMALEFNIDPASNQEEFVNNIKVVMATLKERIGDCEFMQDCTVDFDMDFFKQIPAVNRALGCSTDSNAWTLENNPKPDSTKLMRTVGGHVHIGGFGMGPDYNWEYFEKCANIARLMDKTVGVYSVLWDKDKERRKMYGKAGSFRAKPYGVEYRTLSNKWLFNEDLVKFVFDGAREAMEYYDNGNVEVKDFSREIIDNSYGDSSIYTSDSCFYDFGGAYAVNKKKQVEEMVFYAS